MKSLRIASIILLSLVCVAFADFFPLSGYGCERLNQADSCNLNTALFYCDLSTVGGLLDTAEDLGMKVILTRARRTGTPDITHISGGQRSIYEAESDAYSHQLGAKIYDAGADNDTAWVVCGSQSGWLQASLWTNEQKQVYANSLNYFAYFRLKTNNNTGTTPVCSLLIRRKANGIVNLEAYRVLTRQDFVSDSLYDTFIVAFDLVNGEGDSMDYAIWYMGTNDSIYSDRVDVRDAVADSLKNGDYIVEIAEYYNLKPVMFRYYMWDEPQLDQF